MIPAKVKRIRGLMTDPELELLCRMAQSARSIVELGIYKGRSLAAMMLTNPKAQVWGVDSFGDMTASGYKGASENEVRATLAKVGLEPAGLIVARTDEAAQQFNEQVELLHIDAGHSYEECSGDLKNWIPKALPGGAVCVHDYGEPRNPELSRPGVRKAVDEWRNQGWVEVERADTMIAFRNIVAKRGALYVAFGEAAIREAEQSIRTLKSRAPRLPVAVVSDQAVRGADISIYHVPADAGGRTQKTRIYALSPFEETLYLDADTRVIGDPEGGFQLLAYVDLVLAQDSTRIFSETHWQALNPDEVAETKAELDGGHHLYYNNGVIFFRRNERTQAMMQSWHQEWRRYGWQDQPALLRAMHKNPVRVATMRPAWNTRRPNLAKFVIHSYGKARQAGAPR